MRIVRADTNEYEDYVDFDGIQDALTLMGFVYLEMNFYRRLDDNEDIIFYAEVFDDGVIVDYYENGQRADSITVTKPEEVIDFVEGKLKAKGVDNVKIVKPDELDMPDDGISVKSVMSSKRFKKVRVNSAKAKRMTTRDFVDKLMRVKSSNVWAYAFNPKDEYTGDMLMQFKSKEGGPGDIYIYYDVPNKIWQRLVAAPSTGHAFWELIRNRYTYAKLTGDKRTKLANGI